LYLVTRADLAPGTQACQAAHAAFDFAVAFPDLTRAWHHASNTLVILAVRDELELAWLCQDAAAAGFRLARVHEPDLADALTAVGLEPAAARLVRRLPLAFPPATSASARHRAGGGAGAVHDGGEEVRTCLL
jgi:peptidyl-tRNA hydrolase